MCTIMVLQTTNHVQRHPVPLLTEGVCRTGLTTEHKAEGDTDMGQPPHRVLPWKGLEQREWWGKWARLACVVEIGTTHPRGCITSLLKFQSWEM